MDLSRIARQLGIDDRAVLSKAREFVALASARVPGGLGQGEMCKAAVCLELANNIIGTSSKDLTRERFVKMGCCSTKVYTNTFTVLQQALGAQRKVDLQHLVVKFGCAAVRLSVTRVLTLYKERFVAALREADRRAADFGRPVFLAVAFVLVARKNKIKVDQRALLEDMSVPREDFLNVSASMYELCFDVVGVEKTKKKAEGRKTNTAVMDNHRKVEESASDDGGEDAVGAAGPSGSGAAGSSGASAAGAEGEGGAGAGGQGSAGACAGAAPAEAAKKVSKKAARAADYEEWKALVLLGRAAPAAVSGGGAGGDKESAADGGKESAGGKAAAAAADSKAAGGKAAGGKENAGGKAVSGTKRARGDEGPAAGAPAGGKLKQAKLSFAPLAAAAAKAN
ncbi:hypothetical protein FOA52_014632 [Chlamydomonas sp. UWO 241]|nr:hypothetical protein FOA52_014632 [Chlamydomonas sp. UWO 241]